MITINGNPITINGNFIGDIGTVPLPPYTLRLKFKDGVTPTFSKGTGVQVSSSPNVWDLTYENNNWDLLLYEQSDLLEVLGANTTGVTSMSYMFYNCTSLSSIPLFDTSNVTDMGTMFGRCFSLTVSPLFDTSNVSSMASMFFVCSSLCSVPLFNTTKVTSMPLMFNGCKNVQSGALALYQQASTQATPPRYHNKTFYNCGINTQTGSAELMQIPSDWK